jgi:hypothetical protein
VTQAAAAAEAARRVAEEALLCEAAQIRARRAAASAPPGPDPARRPGAKSHRDHLQEEMAWLSKEFARERRWRVATAKRVALAAARSNLDVESRVAARAAEEEKARRRRAAWIAREVVGFRAKAARVAAFKQCVLAEARQNNCFVTSDTAITLKLPGYCTSKLQDELPEEEDFQKWVCWSRAELQFG